MNDFDDAFKDWDASYVLGALSPDERKEYESHLAHCANCSSAVAIFAGIPGILSKVDSQTAIGLVEGVPTDPILDSWNESVFMQKLVKRVDEERRITRIRQTIGLVAASVILIAFGITAGAVIHSSSNGNLTAPTNSVGRPIHVTNLQPQIM
ncbi:MAG TPA: zf-HC2 domain-containing protein, partial [Candidatus Nanopelagicaceae bacterium]